MNPYFKLVKKNEAIHVSIEGDITFQDVALGVATYLELVSEQHGVSLSNVKETFNSILTQIEKNQSKLTDVEVTESEGN